MLYEEIFLFSEFFNGSSSRRYQRKLVKVPEPTPRCKRIPLTQAKRSQLKSRLGPIVENFKKIAEEELVDVIDLIALIGHSVFLNANDPHFNKQIGQFFQSYLLGKYVYDYWVYLSTYLLASTLMLNLKQI